MAPMREDIPVGGCDSSPVSNESFQEMYQSFDWCVWTSHNAYINPALPYFWVLTSTHTQWSNKMIKRVSTYSISISWDRSRPHLSESYETLESKDGYVPAVCVFPQAFYLSWVKKRMGCPRAFTSIFVLFVIVRFLQKPKLLLLVFRFVYAS